MSILLVTLFSCKKDKENEPEPASDFQKGAMLENIGNNIIIPAYQKLKDETNLIDSAMSKFITTPDITNLVNLQNAHNNAYLAWQNASAFEFGPAEQLLLRTNTNIFPTDTTQIALNISSGSYDLSAVSNIDAKGFPAMDYLLFGIGPDNNAILSKYISDVNANARRTYLQNIYNEVKTNINSVYTGWATGGGNYVSTFKNNTGSDVGGSIGMLVNQLNYDLETLKNAKIGIPLGKKTLGTPLPEKAEALYSMQSLTLAKEHLTSIENIYLGRSKTGADGLGLDDYIEHVKAQHPLGPLNNVIKNKFASAKAKLAAIPETLSQSVLSSASTVDAAYIELQQLVVLLKVDMPSALGVMITYQDNDGD